MVMTRLTLKTVNNVLAAKFHGKQIELVKGEGYFYFVGADVEHCETTSVMVYRLNDLFLDHWVAEARSFLEESAKRAAELAESEPHNLIIRRMAAPEPVQPQTIDLTPTWVAIMPVLIAALQDGTHEGQKSAREELMRAAAILDSLKVQKEDTANA